MFKIKWYLKISLHITNFSIILQIPHSKSEEPKVKQEYIDELISNIKSLKGKQDCAEQGMRHLRRENRVLWRQVNLLTERYSKQQAVIQQVFINGQELKSFIFNLLCRFLECFNGYFGEIGTYSKKSLQLTNFTIAQSGSQI